MAETYSLNATAARAHPPQVAKVITLPDSAAAAGSQQAAMRNGTQVLCKNPDGSQEYYLIDHSRSIPPNQIYLLRVRP